MKLPDVQAAGELVIERKTGGDERTIHSIGRQAGSSRGIPKKQRDVQAANVEIPLDYIFVVEVEGVLERIGINRHENGKGENARARKHPGVAAFARHQRCLFGSFPTSRTSACRRSWKPSTIGSIPTITVPVLATTCRRAD